MSLRNLRNLFQAENVPLRIPAHQFQADRRSVTFLESFNSVKIHEGPAEVPLRIYPKDQTAQADICALLVTSVEEPWPTVPIADIVEHFARRIDLRAIVCSKALAERLKGSRIPIYINRICCDCALGVGPPETTGRVFRSGPNEGFLAFLGSTQACRAV